MNSVICSYSYQFGAIDSKTNKSISFDVEKEYKSLTFNFKYSPKKYLKEGSFEIAKKAFLNSGVNPTDETVKKELPLNNLITLYIDSPFKLLGAAHRHLNDASYMISENEASVGFIPSRIYKGKWGVTFSLQCILENVTVSLEVIAND